MRIQSHLDWIFNLSVPFLALIWFLGHDPLEIGVFDAAAGFPCSSGHVTPIDLLTVSFVDVPLSEVCLFISDCWGRSGATSGATHTATPRTVIVL